MICPVENVGKDKPPVPLTEGDKGGGKSKIANSDSRTL